MGPIIFLKRPPLFMRQVRPAEIIAMFAEFTFFVWRWAYTLSSNSFRHSTQLYDRGHTNFLFRLPTVEASLLVARARLPSPRLSTGLDGACWGVWGDQKLGPARQRGLNIETGWGLGVAHCGGRRIRPSMRDRGESKSRTKVIIEAGRERQP